MSASTPRRPSHRRSLSADGDAIRAAISARGAGHGYGVWIGARVGASRERSRGAAATGGGGEGGGGGRRRRRTRTRARVRPPRRSARRSGRSGSARSARTGDGRSATRTWCRRSAARTPPRTPRGDARRVTRDKISNDFLRRLKFPPPKMYYVLSVHFYVYTVTVHVASHFLAYPEAFFCGGPRPPPIVVPIITPRPAARPHDRRDGHGFRRFRLLRGRAPRQRARPQVRDASSPPPRVHASRARPRRRRGESRNRRDDATSSHRRLSSSSD